MILGGTLLLHGEKWAATVDDLPTVRRIRMMLAASVANHRAIAAEIQDEAARREFNDIFAEDIRRCEAVIATCDKRLEDLPVNTGPSP